MDLSIPIYRLKRQAKLYARSNDIPLHEALDQTAQQEGYRSWSHLSATHSAQRPAARLLGALQPGELVLLAARPGHGKTLLALELLCEVSRGGRMAHFFTLDYTEDDVSARLADLGLEDRPTGFLTDTSDQICADYVLDQLRDAVPGTVVVIDYMQLLDQKRSKPPLDDQIAALRAGAERLGVTVILISQVSRRFDPTTTAIPTLKDVNLPNPVDLGQFAKTCFLQDGRVRVTKAVG